MSNPNPVLSPRAAKGSVGWDDERAKTAARLWGEGKSAGEIAKILGGTTRSAVLGKIHRLGLAEASGKPDAIVNVKREPKRRKVKTEAQARADTLRAPPVKRARAGHKTNFNIRTPVSTPRPIRNGDGEIIKAGEPWVPLNRYDRAFKPLEGTSPRPFLERTFGQCRWPIDGADGEFLACCAKTDGGKYCPTHHELGHTASTRKTSASELARSARKVA